MLLTRMWQSRALRAAIELAAGAIGPQGAEDVVLMPCWRRPEFLWHCLENLLRADGVDDLHVVFRPDSGHSTETLEVIEHFAPELRSWEIQHPPVCPFRRAKQSANLLLGYLLAASRARRFVFLLEEDVMISRDFFRWHRAVHAAADPLFCSIAVRHPDHIPPAPDDAEGFYLNYGDFCSYGVCFDRSVLRQELLPHINLNYLKRPKRYVARHFPRSRVGLGFVEQDGLIRRIQELSSRPIAYPCVPRAFDAGFYGYNRPGGLPGSLASRVEQLRNIIYQPARLREAASEEFTRQCVPFDLDGLPWARQRLA